MILDRGSFSFGVVFELENFINLSRLKYVENILINGDLCD